MLWAINSSLLAINLQDMPCAKTIIVVFGFFWELNSGTHTALICESLLGFLTFRPYTLLLLFFFFTELIWGFQMVCLMESDCNASGPLKIFYWAATKAMLNFVVQIKVLCSKQFQKKYRLGGSLCLLVQPRAASSGWLYLAEELEDSSDCGTHGLPKL